jgi:PleD family two-component response regulator
VCPPLTTEQISNIAESLLDTARTVEVEHETTHITLTISPGFASFLPSDKSEIDTLKRADQTLYQDKEAWRDRFVIS